MFFVNSLKWSFINRGFLGTFLVALSYISDFFFDLKYGTETASWVELSTLEIDSENIERGVQYQPTHVVPLRNLFKILKLPLDKIIVDFGSGKGRVLLLAGEYGFKEVHGVEFSKALCDIAEKNIAAFLKRTDSSTIMKTILRDVTKYSIKETEDVFFLNNPFDDLILKTVIANIKSSLNIYPRQIWIIYANAFHKDIIEQDTSFVKIMEYQNLRLEFTVFTNKKGF